ncbi:MAG: iron ABC transporter permease [Acetobacteraceae bacterium]|nr:iron ABC transporter permease [Acetobacteraceae bacterium]
MRRLLDPRLLTSLIVGAILAVLMLPPLVMLVQGSVLSASGTSLWTLSHFRDLFTAHRGVETMANSIVFAGGSTLLSLLIGGVMAWLVERTNAPLRWLAWVATVISLGTPYVLHVVAWLFLLGPVGPFNDFYRMLGGGGNLVQVQSMGGMILIEGFLWSPLVFLLLGSTFRAANADMEEAARTSGATVLQTVWRISIRLAMPAILALALFVFIRAIGAFEVPALVGIPSRIYVLTTAVYDSMTRMPPNLGYASAFAVVMVVLVSVLLHFYSRLSANAEKYQSVTGKGYRPRPFDLGAWRWIAGGLILLNFLVVLVLPLLALLWLSLQPYSRGFSLAGLKSLTADNYRAVIDAPNYLELAVNSMIIAAGAASVIMLLAAFAGWIAARRGPGGRTLDQLAMLSLVFPGIVLGVAVMEVYLRVPLPIYGTLWIIGIAYVIRFMPFGMRYVYAGVLQLHIELEEAAGVSGAGYLTVLRRIVAPLLTPAMVAGWLFIFLIANKELAIAVLLASPGSQVAAVAVFDLWVNGQGGELAAFGLLWTVLMTGVAFLFFFQSRRGGTDIYGN